jgi:hypothetical protein
MLVTSQPSGAYSRGIGDYLYSLDPSGQKDFAYATDPDRTGSIFDLPGSGYIQKMRIVADRNPVWLSGPCYDMFGQTWNGTLTEATNHDVFTSGTPVSNLGGKHPVAVSSTINKNFWPNVPIDFRYDTFRGTWGLRQFLHPGTIIGAVSGGYYYFDINNKQVVSGINTQMDLLVKSGNDIFAARNLFDQNNYTTNKIHKWLQVGDTVLGYIVNQTSAVPSQSGNFFQIYNHPQEKRMTWLSS